MSEGFRDWMYPHLDLSGSLRPEFCTGVDMFLRFALSPRGTGCDGVMLCPCTKCRNSAYQHSEVVHTHLLRWRFLPNYIIWSSHGKSYDSYGFELGQSSSGNVNDEDESEDNDHADMIQDMFPEYNIGDGTKFAEDPNPRAEDFYELFQSAQQPLWPGHDKTELEWVSEIMSYKTGFRVSQAATDKFIQAARSMAPAEHRHRVPDSFRKVKGIMMKLGLTVIKYDICVNDCFLYYKEGADLVKCPVCGEDRYKSAKTVKGNLTERKKLWYFPITERLQRMYMSSKTAEHMTWHKKYKPGSNVVIHPAGSQAWADFDEKHPEFAAEARNVRLGLSSDGFEANKGKNGKPHSMWPVMVTPYNLPPDLAMRQEFIFLSLIISGPNSPGKNIDVMLRPLFDELKMLWSVGAITYDAFMRQNFTMKAALMWTISDFPAYGMLSGWSTHGRLACPYCMEKSDAFYLNASHKPTQKICLFKCKWFDPGRRGTTRHKKFGFIDIVSSRFIPTEEPYILASDVCQVYFSEYPSSLLDGPRKGVWAVCPVRPRHIIDISSMGQSEDIEAEYYQDPAPPSIDRVTDELSDFVVRDQLVDSDVKVVEVVDRTNDLEENEDNDEPLSSEESEDSD